MSENRKTLREVRFYSRPGCHLCEQAEELLAQIAALTPLQVIELNILDTVALYERYKHCIPVIEIVGGATYSAPIDAQALTDALTVENG